MKKIYNRKISFWIFLLFCFSIIYFLGLSNLRFSKENPGGNDFLVHWMGTRMLMTQGVSPYSEEAAMAIQKLIYGRPAMDGEHEFRVAYPLYSIIIFLPFALFKNYDYARALWMTSIEFGLVFLAIICLRLTEWKPKKILFALYIFFSLFWYHAFRALINGNAVVLVAIALAGTLLAIKNKSYKLAGFLLAISTIKPQVAILIVILFIFWAIIQNKWQFLGWFLGTLGSLCVICEFLVPNWMWQNYLEIIRYPGYNPPGNPVTALAELIPAYGSYLGWIISVSSFLILLVEWFFRNNLKSFKGLLWVCLLTLTLGQWLGIQTDPGNFLVALPAIPFIMVNIENRWKKFSFWINLIFLVTLFFGLWLLFLITISSGAHPLQSPSMFFPLPGFLTLMLYIFRRWKTIETN